MGVLSELPEIYQISASLLLVTSILFLANQAAKPKANFPLVGTWSSDFVSMFFARFKFVMHARGMLDSGYSKYPDTPFQIPTNLNTKIIIPPKHIEELRNYPVSKLSLIASVHETLQGKNVGFDLLGAENAPHNTLVKTRITPNLARLIDPIADEAKFAFGAEIGPTKEWKSICLHSTLVRIISRITSRVYVGEELCRKEDWIRIPIQFTDDIFNNTFLMATLPQFLHPLASFLAPFRRRVRRHREDTRKYLGPKFEQRLADKEAGKPGTEDVFGWMVGHAESKWQNVNDLADFNLLLFMSAIYGVTTALDAIIYDLVEHSEYIEPLREEIIQAVTEDGGQLKKSTIAKMMKLDSFMKECQRFNSSVFSFSRKALESIRLSDGTHIPAGSKLAVAAHSVNFDPKNFENPFEFDGYRFYKMRQQKGAFNRHQYVSTSMSEINFGYGDHACPGRFLTGNIIQVMLIRLLMKYDLKFLEGQRRPKNWELAELNQAPTNVNMLIRERTDVPNWDFL